MCVTQDSCVFATDCDYNKICRRGHCVIVGLTGWQIGVIIFGGFGGFIGTILVLHYIRQRQLRQQNALLTARRSMISTPLPPQNIYASSYGQTTAGPTITGTSHGVPVYDPPPTYTASQEGKY
jgi:hypothetical protein